MGILTTEGTCDQCNEPLPEDDDAVVEAKGHKFDTEECRDQYVKEHEDGTVEHEDAEDENVCEFC